MENGIKKHAELRQYMKTKKWLSLELNKTTYAHLKMALLVSLELNQNGQLSTWFS
jgi:uncharacterized membrane protein YcaP (DUF421 family)